MKKTYLIIIGVIGIIAAILLINRFLINKNSDALYKGNTAPASSIASLSAKTNSEGAVTVEVTLIDQLDWSFEIALNTHSVDIGEDLVQVSVLVDEKGTEYKPIAWEGDPPGGHHLTGILRFGEIVPVPRAVVLTIRQIGGIAEREFEWITQP